MASDTVQDRVLEMLNQPKMANIDGVRIQNQNLGDAVKAMEALGADTTITDVAANKRFPALMVQTLKPGGAIRPV